MAAAAAVARRARVKYTAGAGPPAAASAASAAREAQEENAGHEVSTEAAGAARETAQRHSPRKRGRGVESDAAEADSADPSHERRRAAIAAAHLPPAPPRSRRRDAAGPAAPARNAEGSRLVFPDFPEFLPNQTPKQVLQAGAFGGTYFRPIHSAVTGQDYADDWREFPDDWFEGLPESRVRQMQQIASPTYAVGVNKYRTRSGQSLEAWESSGWIRPQDPRGWFQWYCRFYLGRRTVDDARQVARWMGVAGPRGRWVRNLVNQCRRQGKAFDDGTVAPVIRQLLLHWAFDPTAADLGPSVLADASRPEHAVPVLTSAHRPTQPPRGARNGHPHAEAFAEAHGL